MEIVQKGETSLQHGAQNIRRFEVLLWLVSTPPPPPKCCVSLFRLLKLPVDFSVWLLINKYAQVGLPGSGTVVFVGASHSVDGADPGPSCEDII